MSKKTILHIGDPLLRAVSHPVTKFDRRLQMIVRDMGETMYDANGIGLAAPQIGLMRRLVVIDLYDDEGLRVFINPEITGTEGEVSMEEGCLSIPGRRGCVKRPEKITLRYQDLKGKAHEIEAEGLLSRALQHEIDHLNGVLYVDIMEYEVFEDEDEDEETQEKEPQAAQVRA
jgi:peptide deformylase